MTVTQEKIDNLTSKIHVKLTREDYEPNVKKQIKTLAKKVSVKGFRPGMVPVDMVKKMYGNSVLFEELQNVIQDEVHKYISDNNLEVLLAPIPAKGQRLDVDINSLRDIDFEYELATAPDIDLSFIDADAALTKYRIKVEDSMLDDEVLRIRQRFSTYEYPETVGEKDVLTFTVEEINPDGTLRVEGQHTVTTLTVDLLKEEAQKQILPLKKQESFEYNVFELMDRDRESIAKNVLNMNDLSKLESVGDKFRLTLNNITRSVPAVINEEFFQKVYGENGPKTEEEMRANIKTDLEAIFDGNTDRVIVNDIYKAVMEKANFSLPEEFLKRWISVSNENKITAEEIEKEYPSFLKALRWQLVQRKVVKEQGIEITDAEVSDRVRNNLIHQLYGYGLKNIGHEWIEQFVQKQLADKKVVSDTQEQLREDKVLNYIKSKVRLEEKDVTLDEFQKLLGKQDAEV